MNYEKEENKRLQQKLDEMNDELCKLLPGCQYMDPPDGGCVTPLEQVSRMVVDYRHQIAELASGLRKMIHAQKYTIRAGYERIIDLGGDCDTAEQMISENPDILAAEKILSGITLTVGRDKS